jgi:hypothetical protein
MEKAARLNPKDAAPATCFHDQSRGHPPRGAVPKSHLEDWDREGRMIVTLVLMAQVFCGVGCTSNSKHNRDQGSVYVTIFQPNRTLIFDDRLIFEVRLPEGSVRKIESLPSKIGEFPYKTNCSEQIGVKSPDQASVASCTDGSHDIFFVRDSTTGTATFQAKLSYSKIAGIVWAPDSSAVAILTTTSYTSVNPKFWFGALSGHPKQFEKYRLEIVDPQSQLHHGIDMPYESSLGYGQIGAWSQMR